MAAVPPASSTTRYFAGRRFALERFDLNSIEPNSTIVVIGRRGSGKSTLIKAMLRRDRRSRAVMCMSGTEDSNSDYAAYVPNLFVYNQFDMDAFRRFIDVQQRQSDEYAKGLRKDPPDRTLLCDDVMYDRKPMRSTEMRRLLMNGRHWHTKFILAMQYCMDIEPALRTQIDYVMAFRDPIRKNRRRLHENYFGVVDDFGDFSRIFEECTEGYGFLVARNNVKSNRVSDCLFWGEAELHDNQAAAQGLVAPVAWRYAAERAKGVDDGDDDAASDGGGDGSCRRDASLLERGEAALHVPLTPAKRREMPLEVIRLGK